MASPARGALAAEAGSGHTGGRAAEPRRILFVNSWSSAHGGSATSLIDIVSRLDRSRFDPVVLCPEPGDLPARLAERNVPVIIHRMTRFSASDAPRFLAEIPWYLRLLQSRRIGLVHGNTSASRRSVLQAVALRGIPYVQHVRNGVKNAPAQFGYRLAARIVTNSDAVAADLLSDPLFAPKTLTIHNAVDLSLYEAQDDRRTEIGAMDRPVIGFVGQIVPRKGLTTLITAMPHVLRQVPQALLVIVGCAPPDEPDYERTCREMVATLGLTASVRFVGYRRDVPAWMRTFDVFALPTRSEPFGKVVIEAMAARTPVVVSAVGGIPEIVVNPDLGTLVPPDDAEATAREILRYLQNPELRAKIGTRAQADVRHRFGLDSMVRRLETLYEELLELSIVRRAV